MNLLNGLKVLQDFFTNNNRSNNQQRIIDLDDCEYHYTHRALLSNIIIERSLKRGMNFLTSITRR